MILDLSKNTGKNKVCVLAWNIHIKANTPPQPDYSFGNYL